MSEPIISLSIAISVIILSVIIFRPNSRFLIRWRQIRQDKQRVFMEDALKHLYECERNNTTCTLVSIAGVLSQNTDKAATVMTILESSNLVQINQDSFQLTSEGRDYALKIIRVHRLWERYLAEETGVPESSWHEEADIQEHNLTADQAEMLNKRLGNPLYDPHGDPIPTPAGEIPVEKGVPLSNLEVGKTALITHIEDEPRAIYDKLIKNGFHLGMQIQVKNKEKNGYTVIVEGYKKKISQLEALNVNVFPISEKQRIEFTTTTLDSLTPGQTGEIIAISKACHGQQRRRLMDFGVLPGTEISVEMESLGGDPIAYFIRGTTIALRRNQAKMIQIKPQMEN